MAIIAALFGALACNAGLGAEPLPEGGGGDSDGSSASMDGAVASMDGADAGCGTIPAPNAWASWVMPNPAKSGLPNPASYTVSDGGHEVSDDVTGLTWQRNIDSRSYTWEEAKHYCACLTIDGVAGWRLPSRIELVSIADWTTAGPSIDSNAFPSTPSESFWSSSVLNSDPGLGWLVYFQNGHSSYSDVGYTYRARCVRSSASAPSARYTIANGTVYDTATKLTWEQVISTSSYTWVDAKTYCSGLSLNGTGWRLPAIGELQTIVDDSTNPSVDGAAFPMTPSEYFWSSSSVVEDPARAWTCFFANGSTYSFAMTAPKSVRCVR
jgi:hypothetical protein